MVESSAHRVCLVWLIRCVILLTSVKAITSCGQTKTRVKCLHCEDRGSEDEHVADICKVFSFLQRNLCTLQGKLKDIEFLSCVMSLDFICPVETVRELIHPRDFSSYLCFHKPAVNFTNQVRRLRGFLCLINTNLLPYISRVNTSFIVRKFSELIQIVFILIKILLSLYLFITLRLYFSLGLRR